MKKVPRNLLIGGLSLMVLMVAAFAGGRMTDGTAQALLVWLCSVSGNLCWATLFIYWRFRKIDKELAVE